MLIYKYMSGSVGKNNNKVLVIIFVVLCLVSVILVTTIVVIRLPKSDNETDVSSVLPEELRGDNLSKSDQVIKDVTLMLNNPQHSIDDIISYYNARIKEALDNNDTKLAIDIIIQKMGFYAVVEHDCNTNKNDIDSIDLSPYSVEEKMYLASYIVSSAKECEDTELQTEWENRYEKWRNEI